jgi:hypothetical protein
MEDYEKKYYERERLEKAKEALDRLMTDRGFDIKGVHVMLTVRDIQVIFWLQYRPALRFIRRYFTPMGGVVKAGKRLLIHPWAVKRFLNMVGRCPECGRHWDDKPVLQELQENEREGPDWVGKQPPDPRSYEEALKDWLGE